MFIRKLVNLLLAGAAFFALSGCEGGVLDPKGQVGADEKYLIIVATCLMLLVVIPVIVMTLFFAWKYREGRDEIYAPKWAHSTKIETVVWVVPIIIIVVLGIITWRSTHALDPYKKLQHDKDHLVVQVVSLNWKWLFIYPEQGIATVNELAFPTDVPVEFRITSDTTMNSFFIPQLGSQIYSMAGMETQLHLIANEPGRYDGISANYSGEGFTGMKFDAIATPDEAGFEAWVDKVKAAGNTLDLSVYQQLAEPSENHPVEYFGDVSQGLFHDVVMKFMQDHHPIAGDEHSHHLSASMMMEAEK
ncbi:ubiquinol oxidase subunit II [Oceanimonas sp. MB9]|uniref:ubiquinol oxidase subunit II n=1 Tax=Oceanimonas sp. MB9 TaxID=2588453 RepID=UPI0013F598B6|nr:ubiquinol oxidase subunit II [Oceanimonas sp. MB9]NHH99414.1 Cytochrome bo(3) ubiquinol oxidase subunit 2 [Oceanimonas sp. MB9]